MPSPYLLFEFPDQQEKLQPLVFTDPVKVFETNSLSHIPQIFEQIEQMLTAGYYVAGYVSYEAAPAFHPGMAVRQPGAMPLLWFGVFREPQKKPFPDKEKAYTVSEWHLSSSETDYRAKIGQIRSAIEEGITYQVNFTDRLHARFSGSTAAFYRQLTRNQQARYSAYLDLGRYHVLSASPELFFRVDGDKLTAKPMKGTAARGRFPREDEAKRRGLLSSEKEQAENLMIVDLLRNDMSRIAERGSVRTTKLFEAETYPTVHQLTSTIQAELKKNTTLFDWFHALFPCGSITGAPKISTMQLIAELETSPRGVYCGAIGYFTPQRNAVFNVPIRTVVVDKNDGTATYGAGGGITYDSTPEGEYAELFAKARLLTERRPEFQLLESIRLENGQYPLLPYHLNRLQASASYFGFRLDVNEAERILLKTAETYPSGQYKVRLLAAKEGNVTVEAEPVQQRNGIVYCSLASRPVDKRDPFLYHKTTNRRAYEQFKEDQPDQAMAVLLWNEDEELTEFTIGNVVIEKGGKFFTPPVDAGLLAGTFRQYLLDKGTIEERRIGKKELSEADGLWFINSVRGWLKVDLL